MTSERSKSTEGSLLRRWSRLKSEARDKEKASAAARAPGDAAPASRAAAVPGASPVAVPGAVTSPGPDDSLPPVESLTMDSDFAAFMQPKVDEVLRRRALKQLFRDPHFNVMDGLDVYIDDYTQSIPIPPEIVREMVQGRYIFDPPPTRINAQGHVEDIPEAEVAAMKRAASAEAAAEADSTVALPLPAPDADAVAISLPPLEADAATGVHVQSGEAPSATGEPADDAADTTDPSGKAPAR